MRCAPSTRFARAPFGFAFTS